MIRNKVSVERQINERLYQFLVPCDAPLAECLIIIDDIRKYVVDRINEVEKQEQERKAAEEKSQQVVTE